MNELGAVSLGERATLPSTAERAFSRWPFISGQLRELFDRAQAEAVEDSTAMLSRMALSTIANLDFSEVVAARVREKASANLASCSARGRERIEAALAEPTRLLEKLDDFIATVAQPNHDDSSEGEEASMPGKPLSAWDAELRVREFLDNCRQLDRALSDIPRRLRSEGEA